MPDYFSYLPDTPASALWGCTATGAGFSRILAGGAYPPLRHPQEHHFTWENGRILQAFQILFIAEGGGSFEFGPARRTQKVVAGQALVLFPGIWHRYTPDPQTGWSEHWIEGVGPAFEEAQKRGVINPAQPVFEVGAAPAILECFARVHQWARSDALKNQDVLSTLALHILALVVRLSARTGDETDAVARMVERGQVLIMERYARPLNVESVAKELQVGYSHFRQAFKERTGVSPKQFHQQMRIRKAQEFLANTDKPGREIAGLLGFSSPFHFSKQFKDAIGDAPSEWRARAKKAGRP